MRHLRWMALSILVTSILVGTLLVDGVVDPCIDRPPHDFGCPEVNPWRGIVVFGGIAIAFVMWIVGSFFSGTDDQ